MTIKRTRWLPVIALGTGGLLAATAVVLVSAADTPASPDRAPDDVRARYSLLKSGPVATDDAAHRVAAMAGGSPDHVRRVAADHTMLTVSSGPEQTCMTVKHAVEAVLSCAPTSVVAAGDKPMVSVTQIDEGKVPTFRVTALLPDGVASASVDGPAGAKAVTVSRNVASTTVAGAPAGLSWRSGTSVRTVRFSSLSE